MTTTIGTGSRVVKVTNQEGTYFSRVWVNYGETATTIHATHTTESGARKWAAKQLAK